MIQWWSAEPERLSPAATTAIEGADEIVASCISLYELAWLARHERIHLAIPVRTWLAEIERDIRIVGISSGVADTAVSLASSFPGDPADRLIYATAIEHGWALVTKDRKMREHPHPTALTLW